MTYFRDTKVLITGAAGFIGSHLADALLKIGCKVIAIDNLDPYYTEKDRNIEHNLCNPNYHFLKLDILSFNHLVDLFKNVDVVFHLAAQPGVRCSFEDPTKTNEVNTNGTLNVLLAAKRYGVRKVIFASSSSVYGPPKYLPVDEEHPVRPISIYGISKLAAERYCLLFYKLMKVPIVILRYHTVYGPRQRPDMAIYKWTKAIYEGKPLLIYGDGRQTRDFTHVSDIVNGTLLAAEIEGIEGEIFNLGSGRNVGVNETVRLLIKLLGKDFEPLYETPMLGDVPDTCANISKAARVLGYRPQVEFEDGLRSFLSWFSTRAIIRS